MRRKHIVQLRKMSFNQYLFKKQRRLNIGCNFVLQAAFLLIENLSLSFQIEILHKIDQWNWFYEHKCFFVQFRPGPFPTDVESTLVYVSRPALRQTLCRYCSQACTSKIEFRWTVLSKMAKNKLLMVGLLYLPLWTTVGVELSLLFGIYMYVFSITLKTYHISIIFAVINKTSLPWVLTSAFL